MRSHTPEETPDETKQRKQREKDYRKSRGADFNYVRLPSSVDLICVSLMCA